MLQPWWRQSVLHLAQQRCVGVQIEQSAGSRAVVGNVGEGERGRPYGV